MTCPKCGYSLPADSAFCQYCGIKLDIDRLQNDVTVSDHIPVSEQNPTAENLQTDEPVHAEAEASAALEQVHAETQPSDENQTFVPDTDAHTVMRKIRFCKRCGGAIDGETKKCSGCGKQYFRLKITIPTILVTLAIVLLAGLNVFQFWKGRESSGTIDHLEAQIASHEKTISRLSEEKASLSLKARYYDDICSELSSGNLGYAASNFQSSESVIVLSKNETNRKFTLTAHWGSGGTVHCDYSSHAAMLSFDNDSWSYSTTITINPKRPGVTAVTFSNSADSKTFKVLIIVTD